MVKLRPRGKKIVDSVVVEQKIRKLSHRLNTTVIKTNSVPDEEVGEYSSDSAFNDNNSNDSN